jgi:hypothetical protein
MAVADAQIIIALSIAIVLLSEPFRNKQVFLLH